MGLLGDEKKKRRNNKKKKSKQNNKVAEDTGVTINGEGGAAPLVQQDHLNNVQNHDGEAADPKIEPDGVKANVHQADGVEPLNSDLASEKQVRLQIEKSNKETISIMEMELRNLRLQVEGLEESKTVSMQENEWLTDVICGIQNLQSSNISISHALDEQRKHSSECDILNSQLDGACVLVEKLITENSELIEKVNELYLKLDKLKVSSRHSHVGYNSTFGRDGTTDVVDGHSVSSKNLLVLAEKTEPPSEMVIVQDEPLHSHTGYTNNSIVISDTLQSDESRELVKLQPDETDVQTSEQGRGGTVEESMTTIPLSDARLIGAPFRFISSVAGYVSGADLADKNST
ncbi:hypothetical protein SAY87_012210 [Trapa incisa]|uniref:Uncharacterized protein n=1 Tax=Trapa incisa TaxID=236973 RepID=A0AAN7JJZ0_9MYRT|nr:hypothetical protein SAY87_012210 [Trapa incisa]